MDKEIIITNPQGLHARPASALVEQMKSFDAKVRVEVGAKAVRKCSEHHERACPWRNHRRHRPSNR